MRKAWMVCCLGVLLAGCAAAHSERPASANAAKRGAVGAEGERREAAGAGAWVADRSVNSDGTVDELLCWRERPTGTNMLEKVCRWRSSMARTREATQSALRQFNSPSPQLERN